MANTSDYQTYAHLLANPNHIKKVNKGYIYTQEELLEKNIFRLLTKRFPQISIYENNYNTILEKIESICISNTISNVLDDIIIIIEENGEE